MTTTDPDSRVGRAPAPALDADTLRFPADFVWGAATAAFQIEGSTTVDGRTPSIWDTFAATPGKVLNGDNGDPACDHYNRSAEDVELMSQLGLAAYRFSTAWSRIVPAADGKSEPRGLAFYDRLVDQLLAKGITPVATLYHWDLPQWLEDQGGWRNRDTAYRFAEYAQLVHGHLGDRVALWSTLNEPWCSSFLGHHKGIHAPGLTDSKASLETVHHLLLAHGLATRAMRAQATEEHRFSLVLNFTQAWADNDDTASRDAVRKVDGLHNRIFLDPVLGRGYPTDVVEDVAWLGDWQRVVQDGDLDVIATPIDFLGVNYYSPTRVAPAADPEVVTEGPFPGLRGVELLEPRGELTSFGWEQNADAFAELLTRLGRDAPGLPIVITENGSAFADEVDELGRIEDPQRVAFLLDHLRAVHRAIEAGTDIRGYLAWSLLDNFEWAEGYSQRFGLVRVDYETQERTVKRSGATLARIITRNSIPATGYEVE